MIFADPKYDFVFKRTFGTEENKHLLIALLNPLLGVDYEHRITDVELLEPTQRPPVSGLKETIVDVKCKDAQGVTYVAEMQLARVAGFGKRVVFNVSKAFGSQLAAGQGYPHLNDVVGVTICAFDLWPDNIPMLSRWQVQEMEGREQMSHLRFLFLELSKYQAGPEPQSDIDRWAYFFLEAPNLEAVPPALSKPPFRDALEAARLAGFTKAEWELYEAQEKAWRDEQGRIDFARKDGRDEGFKDGRDKGRNEGLITGIEEMCKLLDIKLTPERRQALSTWELPRLEGLLKKIEETKSWPAAV